MPKYVQRYETCTCGYVYQGRELEQLTVQELRRLGAKPRTDQHGKRWYELTRRTECKGHGTLTGIDY
jgi:hypothetical protein